MGSHLGDHLRARREAAGLGRGELAARLGYKNLSRGSRRIDALERTGGGPPGFAAAVAGVLGVEPAAVEALAGRDRADRLSEWEAWADEPVPPDIIIRCLPGVYARHPVPAGLADPDELVGYSQGLARRLGRQVFVVVSRRLVVRLAEDGHVAARTVARPGEDIAPAMQAGRHRFVLPVGTPDETKQSPGPFVTGIG